MFIFYIILSNALIFLLNLITQSFKLVKLNGIFTNISLYRYFNQYGLLFKISSSAHLYNVNASTSTSDQVNFKGLYTKYINCSSLTVKSQILNSYLVTYLVFDNLFTKYVGYLSRKQILNYKKPTPLTTHALRLFFYKNIILSNFFFETRRRSYNSPNKSTPYLFNTKLNFLFSNLPRISLNSFNLVKSINVRNYKSSINIKLSSVVYNVFSNNTEKYIKIFSNTITSTGNVLVLTYKSKALVYLKSKYTNLSYRINHLSTSITKNLNSNTLNTYILYFLRKGKVFNKGRYSRNRQTSRVVVFWTIYLSLLFFLGIYYWFYHFVLNFGYMWWFFLMIVAGFFLPKATKFRLYNIKILGNDLSLSLKWVALQIYFILNVIKLSWVSSLRYVFINFLSNPAYNFTLSSYISNNVKTQDLIKRLTKGNNLAYTNFLSTVNLQKISVNRLSFLNQVFTAYNYTRNPSNETFKSTTNNYFITAEYLQLYFFRTQKTSGVFKVTGSALLNYMPSTVHFYINKVKYVISVLTLVFIVLYIYIYISINFSAILPNVLCINTQSLLGLFFFLLSNHWVGGAAYTNTSIENFFKIITLSNYNNTKVNGNQLDNTQNFLSKADNTYFMGKKYGATWTLNEYSPLEYLNYTSKFENSNVFSSNSNKNWALLTSVFNNSSDTDPSSLINNQIDQLNTNQLNFLRSNRLINYPNNYNLTPTLVNIATASENLPNPLRASMVTINQPTSFISSIFNKPLTTYTQNFNVLSLSGGNSVFSDTAVSFNFLNSKKSLVILDNISALNFGAEVRDNIRLTKFFIESTFSEFKGNDWIYFSLLPEKYQMYLYKFKLLTTFISKDSLEISNATLYSNLKVEKLSTLNKIIENQYINYRTHDIYK